MLTMIVRNILNGNEMKHLVSIDKYILEEFCDFLKLFD